MQPIIWPKVVVTRTLKVTATLAVWRLSEGLVGGIGFGGGVEGHILVGDILNGRVVERDGGDGFEGGLYRHEEESRHNRLESVHGRACRFAARTAC